MEGAHLHCRAYVAGHVQRELHDDAGDPELPDQRGLEGKPLVVFEAVDALASPVACIIGSARIFRGGAAFPKSPAGFGGIITLAL